MIATVLLRDGSDITQFWALFLLRDATLTVGMYPDLDQAVL